MLQSKTFRQDGNRATMKLMGVNPYTLSFGNDFEISFKKKYFLDSLLQFRVAFLLVIILYALFTILDWMHIRPYFTEFFRIRFFYVIPFLLFVFAISFTDYFEKYWQRLLTLSFLVAGSGIARMTVLDPLNYAYYAGMMLIFSAGYFFIKLRFFYATLAGWGTLLIFNLMSLYSTEVESKTLVTTNFFYISANVIGMVAAYYIEFYTRRDFYFQKKLEGERQKVIKINKSLEHKVKLRTQEISAKNVELTIARDRAEKSDKMKSQFLRNASHELRTPLNAIIGYSQLILNDDDTSDDIKESANVIWENGKKLERIIYLITEISKIESGNASIKYENINLNELIRSVLSEFDDSPNLKGKTLEIKTSFQLKDDTITTTIEKSRIEQLFINLFDNALKFTDVGHIEVGYTIDDNLLKCFVKDTGPGIPHELQESIFERAMQFAGLETENDTGAGLGLRICGLVVKLYSGKIWLESKPGAGSGFYFTIPFQKIK